jgi:hypothetical protein
MIVSWLQALIWSDHLLERKSQFHEDRVKPGHAMVREMGPDTCRMATFLDDGPDLVLGQEIVDRPPSVTGLGFLGREA